MQTLVLMTDSQVPAFLFQQLYEGEVCIFCHTLLKTIIFTIKLSKDSFPSFKENIEGKCFQLGHHNSYSKCSGLTLEYGQ